MALWKWQQTKHGKSNAILKMGAGCALLAFAYGILSMISAIAEGLVNWSFLVLAIVIWTLGEMYFSPTGLAFVSEAAPKSLKSFMMGCWFLGSFLGNSLSGYLGTFYPQMTHARFFLLCFGLAAVNGVLLLACAMPLNGLLRRKSGGSVQLLMDTEEKVMDEM